MNHETRSDLARLLLRLGLGALMLAHGLVLKVMTFTVAGTVGYFESIGYPGFFAYLIIGGEILAGIALLLGAFTRMAALASIPILIGATLEHVGNGWVFNAPGGGWEYPVFWTLMLVVLALLGGGRWSLDNRLRQQLPMLKTLLGQA